MEDVPIFFQKKILERRFLSVQVKNNYQSQQPASFSSMAVRRIGQLLFPNKNLQAKSEFPI